MDKRALRKEILEIRDKIPENIRLEKDDKIFQKLENNRHFKNAENIFTYIGYSTEIGTLRLINDMIETGKHVYVPYVDQKEKKMKMTRLKDPERELEIGSYGIPEVKEEYRTFSDPNIIDLILMPGVAFDKNRNRLGYGGGYYDKFIDALDDDVYLLAMCYKEQIVEKVPTEVYDKKVDEIITD